LSVNVSRRSDRPSNDERAALAEASRVMALLPATLEIPLTAGQREDPRYLHGDVLRKFAHERGIARSEMQEWDDDKVRRQVSLIVHRQYDESNAR
jgi:hypothetical protein